MKIFGQKMGPDGRRDNPRAMGSEQKTCLFVSGHDSDQKFG